MTTYAGVKAPKIILIYTFSGLNLLKNRAFSSPGLKKKVNQVNARSWRYRNICQSNVMDFDQLRVRIFVTVNEGCILKEIKRSCISGKKLLIFRTSLRLSNPCEIHT